jgi:hypothetical protein
MLGAGKYRNLDVSAMKEKMQPAVDVGEGLGASQFDPDILFTAEKPKSSPKLGIADRPNFENTLNATKALGLDRVLKIQKRESTKFTKLFNMMCGDL